MSRTTYPVESHALTVLKRIHDWPVERLGKWPTPIDRFEHPAFGELLVKRDDLAGFGRQGRSGVKARKLEGFLGYLRSRGYKELIVLLANMTNLGHDIAPLLPALGINLRLLIVDDPQIAPSVRRELFADLPGQVEFLGRGSLRALGYAAVTSLRARMARRDSITVLPSPAHPSAVIGAARGFLEMIQQREAAGLPPPSQVYITAAAGTTVAGFVLAESLLRQLGRPKVHLMIVPVVRQRLECMLPLLLSWTRRSLGMPLGSLASNYTFLRDNRLARYARFDQELENTCLRVASDFGLTIDPIYGAKSWSALEGHWPKARALATGPVMFWHCGYSPDWQVFRSEPVKS